MNNISNLAMAFNLSFLAFIVLFSFGCRDEKQNEAASTLLPSKQAQAHDWISIEYPSASFGQICLGRSKNNLRFDVLFFLSQLKGFSEFNSGIKSIILWYPDGEKILPISKAPQPQRSGNMWGYTCLFSYEFPWGPNALDEAWIELRFADKGYWIEIPYGFTRDPKAPLSPPMLNINGRPAFALPMNKMSDRDVLVPWLYVHYEIGNIQNGWHLSLKQSNPFNAECVVDLLRHDTQIGKSIVLWDLHTPKTSVDITEPTGHPIKSMCMSIKIHDDGMQRSDTHKIGTYSLQGRRWGILTVSVDEKKYSITVPSSLYNYVHGRADPHSKKAIPSTGEVPKIFREE